VLVVERDWSYELAVTNRGPSVAQGVELVLEWGEGMDWVGFESGEEKFWEEGMGALFEVGELGVGEVVTVGVLMRGRVEGSWTNVARVSGLEADPEMEDNEVEWVSEVRRESDLGVELGWLWSEELLVGQEARYEVRVSNRGPQAAREVRLEAVWDGAVELVEVEMGQGSWEWEEGGVVMGLGTMEVGEEREIGMVVRVLVDGGLTGQVRVSSLELDPEETDNEAQVMVMVRRLVDLRLEQWSEPTVLLGSETRQVWRVRNEGPSEASGVVLVGEWELGLELTGMEGSQGVWTNAGNEVRWEVGGLGLGMAAELELTGIGVEVGWWTNRAMVSGLEIEAEPEDNVMEEGIEVIPAAALSVSLDEAAEHVLLLGEELRYAVKIRNDGPSRAHEVNLVGSVSAGLELIEIDSPQGSGGIEADGGWTWDLGELAAGDTIEMGLIVRGARVGLWEWNLQVQAQEEDPLLLDNRLEWVIDVRQEADLGLDLRVDRSVVLVGDAVVYELGLTNRGPHTASGVIVDWEWLGKIDLVEVHASQGEWIHTPSRLACDLGDLQAGTEAYVQVVVQAARAGDLGCEVVVHSSVPDPDQSDNEAVAEVVVLPPADLRITQTAFPDPVMVGDQLVYRITVQNLGGYVVPDVQVTAWLAPTTEFVSAITSQGLTTNEAGVVEWELGPLEPVTSATVTLTVVPHQVGMITNTVTVASSYMDPDNPNRVSQLALNVVDAPPLRIERDGSRVVLSWPALAQDYILFTTDRLTQPLLWYPDGNPREMQGNRITVTVKVTQDSRFYRLSRP
jgi:large repetitive protein